MIAVQSETRLVLTLSSGCTGTDVKLAYMHVHKRTGDAMALNTMDATSQAADRRQ